MDADADRGRVSLYLITDRKLARHGLIAECQEALGAAARLNQRVAIQLREKDLDARQLYELARELRCLCARYSAKLLINDRLDIALAVDADGVHLPVDSFEIRDARKLLGPGRLIGVSTHVPAEVKAAADAGADLAVFGPIYQPLSKTGYLPAAGIDRLKAACEAGAIAVYALGGITAERIRELRDSGAAGVAAIGSVMGADSPGDSAAALLTAIHDYWRLNRN